MAYAFKSKLSLVGCFVLSSLTGGCDGDGDDLSVTPPMEEIDAGFPDSGEQPLDCSTRPADAPQLRSESSLVYDEAQDRLIMYGGNVAPVMCPFFSRTPSLDIWAFELDCNNWQVLSPPASPPARVRHAAAVDTSRNRMVIFGGRQGTSSPYVFLNDVWAFDLASDSWSQIVTSGVAPAPRDDAVMEYDALNDRMVIFGGDTDFTGTLNGRQGDLWTLDMQTGAWTQLTPAGPTPPARLLHGSANNGTGMLVFGGALDFFVYLRDMWQFDYMSNTWTEIPNASGAAIPDTRFGPSAFADPARERALVFGGHDEAALGNRNDTWAVGLMTGVWSELSSGDVLNPNRGPNDQCNFPADFTIVDKTVPDRRSAFPYTQSADRAFVFGGNTDCGRANDLWAMDLATGEWSELRAANGGISCPHTEQVSCATLCF